MLELSVVLISKNQEWNIARLIESVLSECAQRRSYEVILVDSASTDQTVAIAAQYPIRILQLSSEQFLSPAAGRYVGYQNTSGEHVLFLDGDNELYPGWLEISLGNLKENDDIGGITGKRVLLPEDATNTDKPPLLSPASTDFERIRSTGGCALFRRCVLDKVGSFNPFLYSDEEPDLALRIRHAGYGLARTIYPISYDYAPELNLISTKIQRWRRNLYLGAGQNLRYRLGTDSFIGYVKERGFGLLPLVGVGLTASVLFWSIIRNDFRWVAWWLGIVGLVLIVEAIRKRSFYLALVSVVSRLVVADGTLRGFLKKPIEPSKYCSLHTVVQ